MNIDQHQQFIAENAALDEALRQRNNNVHEWIREQRQRLTDKFSEEESSRKKTESEIDARSTGSS